MKDEMGRDEIRVLNPDASVTHEQQCRRVMIFVVTSDVGTFQNPAILEVVLTGSVAVAKPPAIIWEPFWLETQIAKNKMRHG